MDFMWKIIGLVSFVLITALVTNCTRKSSVSTGIFDSINDLPKITDPVVGSAGVYSKIQAQSSASQGTKLSEIGQKDWSEQGGLEPASCEVANIYKEMLNNAAESTSIQCHLNAMPTSIFDGKYHLFDMDDQKNDRRDSGEHQPANQETPNSFRVKIKASKDSNGSIRNFEVFACSDGKQEMYAKQSIDEKGSSITLVFNRRDNRGSESFSGQGVMTATGTINSQGQWTSKHVEATMVESGSQYHDSDGSGAQIIATNSSGKLMLDEFGDHILISGGRTGTFGEESFTERFNSAAGVILPTDPDDIFGRQLTDGTAKHISARNQLASGFKHWGADLKPAETSPWASLVGDPPELVISIPSFAADQKWDCTGEFEKMTMDPGTDQQHQQCEIQRQHEFVNCWQREYHQPPEPTHPEQPDESGQPPPPSPSPPTEGSDQPPAPAPAPVP